MTSHSRREFLTKALPGTLVAGSTLALFDSEVARAQRTVAPTFALEIDQLQAGRPETLVGGDIVADVISGVVGPDGIQHKHLANLKYEDIVLTCGPGMSKAFFDWIKSSFDRHPIAKNGAIITIGSDLKTASRVEWMNGYITEVTFPACDTGANNAQTITVRITPEVTRTAAAGAIPFSPLTQVQQWRSPNFALQIAGCETSSKYATSIEALTVKFPLATNQVGAVRQLSRTPGAMQVPDLTVYLDDKNDAQFQQWQQSFEIQGPPSADKEKSGTLHYLGPDLRNSLFTLTFGGLGIYRLAPETVGAMRRVKAQMYCDTIGFTVG